MLPGYFVAIYLCAAAGLCTGSGVTFVERNSFVKLRSEGLASIGYVASRDPDDYVNKMAMTFGQLRLLTPLDLDLFKTGSSTFDIQPSGFRKHRNLNVHGMSMILDIPALGIVLTMKGSILKQNGLLRVGDDVSVGLRRGDVMLSLELMPTYDDQTCIACQVDAGHVIQLEFDVSHTGSPQFSQLNEGVSVLRSYEYSDGSKLYIPEQVFVDGIAQRADLVVAGSENNHNVIMRLPAPLGQKMEVNVIFKIPKPVSQPSTTNVPTIIVEHEKREGKRKSPSGDRLDETSDRPRDQVNMAEGEPERRVIEVRYTTTKATADNENEAKVAMAVNEHLNGSQSHHHTSVLLIPFVGLMLLLLV